MSQIARRGTTISRIGMRGDNYVSFIHTTLDPVPAADPSRPRPLKAGRGTIMSIISWNLMGFPGPSTLHHWPTS